MEALDSRIPLEQLVHELLEAHDDTLELAAQLPPSLEWEIHCAYLRDLQQLAHARLRDRRRVADQSLAQAAA